MVEHDTIGDTLDLVMRAVNSTLLGGAEFWARLNLTMPQLKVLMLLGAHDGVPVSWLASRMRVSPPNVTGILDRLETQGWVRRANDAHDRRVVRVVLTPEGHRLLQDLHEAGAQRVRVILGGMGTDDRAALHQGLAALLDAVDRATEAIALTESRAALERRVQPA